MEDLDLIHGEAPIKWRLSPRGNGFGAPKDTDVALNPELLPHQSLDHSPVASHATTHRLRLKEVRAWSFLHPSGDQRSDGGVSVLFDFPVQVIVLDGEHVDHEGERFAGAVSSHYILPVAH